VKLITNAMLRGACRDQRKLFRKTFPNGAPVTIAAARKAQKAGLDVLWACNLLPEPLFYEYYAKRKPLFYEYDAKRKPLDDEYDAKRESLDDEYDAKRESLFDEYDAKRKPLDDEYYAKRESLDDEYDAKCIKLLVSILRRMEVKK
jgi:hypothetical protein